MSDLKDSKSGKDESAKKNDSKIEKKAETKVEKSGSAKSNNNSEVIVITSGKGGVGKTTTTANVGTGLAKLNKKVVLIDTDIGLRNLDVVMGLENRIVYNLVDVVEGNCRYLRSCYY